VLTAFWEGRRLTEYLWRGCDDDTPMFTAPRGDPR
jgi:hypothetical protein